MKPLTPRIRILFHGGSLVQREPAGPDAMSEFLPGERLAVQFQLEDLERAPVGADGERSARRPREETPGSGRRSRRASRRVRRTRSLFPSSSVKAPGYGGATARTRSWMRFAGWLQSMRPSSGLRPPK